MLVHNKAEESAKHRHRIQGILAIRKIYWKIMVTNALISIATTEKFDMFLYTLILIFKKTNILAFNDFDSWIPKYV